MKKQIDPYEFHQIPSDGGSEHPLRIDPLDFEKNRYSNVLPYHHNIVTETLDNEKEGEYINASHIHLLDNHYIATQGPKENTIARFFDMAFALNASLIVNLTVPFEAHARCYGYWLEKKEIKLSEPGGVVKLVKSELIPGELGKLYTFCRYDDKGKEHFLQMFHYEDWVDQATPKETAHIVDFLQIVGKTAEEKGGPLVVHCSAGIGRTGTFIAMHALMKALKKELSLGKKPHEIETPEIKHLVTEMRKQRKGMVQQAEQYELIHKAINLLINRSN